MSDDEAKPNQSILNLSVGNRLRIEELDTRLTRIERELATQDRVLTELRRDLALRQVPWTKEDGER